jgi:hypothetical protein
VNDLSFPSAVREPVRINPKLGLINEIALSLMPNDSSRLSFVSDLFQGSDVVVDPDKGLMVDGVPINPKGFDLGDISRNIGGIFPLAGQILGSIAGGFKGGVAGSVVPGAGTAAGVATGAVLGGTAGATIGKTIQTSLADLIPGVDIDGKEYLKAAGEEMALAGASEVVGLGIGSVGAKVAGKIGAGKALKGMSNSFKSTMNHLVNRVGTKTAQLYAQYVGGVPAHIAKGLFKVGGPNKVFTPKHMDDAAMQKTVYQALFGDRNINRSIFNPSDGVEESLKMMIHNSQSLKNEGYDQLLRSAGFSDDLIKTVKNTPEGKLFNKKFAEPNQGVKIAENMVKQIDDEISSLGKRIGRSEDILLNVNKRTNTRFSMVDDHKQLTNLVKQAEKGVKVPGGVTEGVDLRKIDEVKKMIRLMEVKGKPGTVADNISPKAYQNIKNNLDLQIKNLFERGEADVPVKDLVRKFASSMRGRYYKNIGLDTTVVKKSTGSSVRRAAREIDDFRIFQEMLDDLKIGGDAASVAKIDNMLKGINKIPNQRQTKVFNTQQERLRRLIDAKPDKFKIFADDYETFNAVQKLKTFDGESIARKLESDFNDNALVDFAIETIKESRLRDIDNLLIGKAAKHKFIKDATRAHVARGFSSNSTNMLRIQALASMTGAAGGFAVGGPTGAGVGLLVTRPEAVRAVLKFGDKQLGKKAIKGGVDAVNKTAEKAMNTRGGKALQNLLKAKGGREGLKAGVSGVAARPLVENIND